MSIEDRMKKIEDEEALSKEKTDQALTEKAIRERQNAVNDRREALQILRSLKIPEKLQEISTNLWGIGNVRLKDY